MKWEGQDQSSNVEDRRGGGSGGGRLPIGGRGIGLGTVAIALVAGWIFGINPLTVLGLLSGGAPVGQEQVAQGPAQRPPANDKAAAFVSTVLRDTEVVWNQVFQASGSTYREPKLVLFRGATPTACGTGEAAMGPFYCPGDQKVYIDLDFFDTLSRRLGAPGDFAQACLQLLAQPAKAELEGQRGSLSVNRQFSFASFKSSVLALLPSHSTEPGQA